MNRCCSAVGVNMMDGVAGRDILLLGEHLRGVIWTVNSLPGCLDFSASLTFFLPYDWPHPWHSGLFQPPLPPALYPQLSSPSEPLSDVLFNWSCPCPQLEEHAEEKGQTIHNKVKKTHLPLIVMEGNRRLGRLGGIWWLGYSRRSVDGKRLLFCVSCRTLCLFSDTRSSWTVLDCPRQVYLSTLVHGPERKWL